MPAGAVGMGEVWRARDTRLDRTVAIRVLPAAFRQATPGMPWHRATVRSGVPMARTLYFIERTTIMSTAFDPSLERAGPGSPVIDAAPLIDLTSQFAHFQVLKDGTCLGVQRIPATRKHLILVQNWYAEFKV